MHVSKNQVSIRDYVHLSFSDPVHDLDHDHNLCLEIDND